MNDIIRYDSIIRQQMDFSLPNPRNCVRKNGTLLGILFGYYQLGNIAIYDYCAQIKKIPGELP